MVGKVNGEYFDIYLTDIKLHTTKPNNNESFSRKVEKSMKNGKPQRVHKKIQNIEENNLKLSIDLPEEAKGKTIRVFIPDDGLPIKLGKDAEEKIKSMEEKGLLKNL